MDPLQTTNASPVSGDVTQGVHLAVELARPVRVCSAARTLPLDVARARHDAELTEREAITGSANLPQREREAPGFEWRPLTSKLTRVRSVSFGSV